jgi:hypothetical protein
MLLVHERFAIFRWNDDNCVGDGFDSFDNGITKNENYGETSAYKTQ